MLETKDLILKKAVFEDWRDIWQNLWRHAESARYMFWSPTCTEEEAMARMERTLAFQAEHPYALFLYEKSSGRAVGFAGMDEIAPRVWFESGIALGPAYTGRGWGSQVLAALREEAFRLGAEEFRGACWAENRPSRAMLRSCGLRYSHTEEHVDPRSGEPFLQEHYVLRRAER